jgi:hypothetical protein
MSLSVEDRAIAQQLGEACKNSPWVQEVGQWVRENQHKFAPLVASLPPSLRLENIMAKAIEREQEEARAEQLAKERHVAKMAPVHRRRIIQRYLMHRNYWSSLEVAYLLIPPCLASDRLADWRSFDLKCDLKETLLQKFHVRGARNELNRSHAQVLRDFSASSDDAIEIPVADAIRYLKRREFPQDALPTDMYTELAASSPLETLPIDTVDNEIAVVTAGYFFYSELADRHGVDKDNLRHRLETWRKRNLLGDGWRENTDRGPRQPKFLFRESFVMHVIVALKQDEAHRGLKLKDRTGIPSKSRHSLAGRNLPAKLPAKKNIAA